MTNADCQSPSARYSILFPQLVWDRAEEYLSAIQTDSSVAGNLLAERLTQKAVASLKAEELLGELFETKKPCCFAESGVHGDGTDWNLTELGLLGDISVAVPVTIFDDGRHHEPEVHRPPFTGTLVFTPGALLRNDLEKTAADWNAVVGPDKTVSDEAYQALYFRRLLPVFEYVNASAAGPRSAVLTVPGLGCGQFAGDFRGSLGEKLRVVLQRFLDRHGESFPNIRAVYYDPYSECENARESIHGIDFLVRPLLRQADGGKPQLCRPADYAEAGDDFSACQLFSIVAWDHVSWPGNDFYRGSRATDDGVKAAATNSMEVLTGVTGDYSVETNAYLPPPAHQTWQDVVFHKRQESNLLLWNPAAVWPPTSGGMNV